MSQFHRNGAAIFLACVLAGGLSPAYAQIGQSELITPGKGLSGWMKSKGKKSKTRTTQIQSSDGVGLSPMMSGSSGATFDSAGAGMGNMIDPGMIGDMVTGGNPGSQQDGSAGLQPEFTPQGNGFLPFTPPGSAGFQPSFTPPWSAGFQPSSTPQGNAGFQPSSTPPGSVGFQPSSTPPGSAGFQPSFTPQGNPGFQPSFTPPGSAGFQPAFNQHSCFQGACPHQQMSCSHSHNACSHSCNHGVPSCSHAMPQCMHSHAMPQCMHSHAGCNHGAMQNNMQASMPMNSQPQADIGQTLATGVTTVVGAATALELIKTQVGPMLKGMGFDNRFHTYGPCSSGTFYAPGGLP